jgi:hypothetical protein
MRKTPIKNITKMISNEGWRQKNPTFEVEPEIVSWAKLHAEFFLKRWKKGAQMHWTTNENRSNFIGLLGQKCFELTLQQLEIPYVPNDPVMDWRKTKDYDFRIPRVGKIEVKTIDYPPNHVRLIAKCAEWHDNDYVFALKLGDETPTKAYFMGYATNKEVLKDFTYTKYEQPCPYEAGRWSLLKNLNSASQFFQMLRDKTGQIWSE